jgi:V/A-type H+-transporting ATPase subunit E
MAHTLESFIDRIRADGVEAGREAADQIRREGQEQADQLVREAEARARQIVAEAEAERERTLLRTQTDLQLAARDTVAKLRDALSQAVTKVLVQAVEQALANPTFLEELIRDITTRYAEADVAGEGTMTINVSESMRERLASWVIATFHPAVQKKRSLSIDVHGTLASAGFEYQVAEGTVEITPASVVQVLSEIVHPHLRELISAAVADASAANGS